MFCLPADTIEEAVAARKDREMSHWKCVKSTPDRRLKMGGICGGLLHAGCGPWLLFLGCEAGWGCEDAAACGQPVTGLGERFKASIPSQVTSCGRAVF